MAKVCEFCGEIISLMSRYCVYGDRRIMCKDCYKIFLEMRDDISAKIEEKEQKEEEEQELENIMEIDKEDNE